MLLHILFLCLFVQSESVTEVRTNIYVTSFGPVSDTDMVCVFLLLLKVFIQIRFTWGFCFCLFFSFFLCIFIYIFIFAYVNICLFFWFIAFLNNVLCFNQVWLHVIVGRLPHEKTEMFSLLLNLERFVCQMCHRGWHSTILYFPLSQWMCEAVFLYGLI